MSGKTPLALLPGLLLDRTFWQHQEAALADVADVWIPDLSTQASFVEMAKDVLSAMPERFALAGLSMGGYVALEIMRQAPERVTKLALMDTQARDDDEATRKRRHGLIELAEKGKFKGVTPRLLPMLIHPDRLEDEPLTQHIIAMAEGIGREGFFRQQRAILARPDSRGLLAGISCQTLVLCGRQDALTPMERHLEMAAGIPNSRLVVIEDCGHLPPLEKPEETNQSLRDWLLGSEE